MEQTLGRGHGHQHTDFPSAAGFAEDGHAAGIAAEGLDIVPHPAQGQDDVLHSRVAGGRVGPAEQLAQVQMAEGVQPVIDRHHHDVVTQGEVGTVVADIGA